MKKLSFIILGLAVSAMTLTLTSCGDDDSYSPGPEVSADCPDVYFPSSNESTVYLDPATINANPDATWTQTVTVSRPDSVGSLTVPIIVDKKSDGMEIPSSVTFNDGEKTADLVVSYTHPDNGLTATFHVDDSYANPYTKKEGAASYSLTITLLQKVCNVTYSSQQRRSLSAKNTSHFANVTSEIWNCKGFNRFLWKDFCGSGIDVFFEVIVPTGSTFRPNDLQSNSGEIHFLDHFTDYYGYGYVFLQSTASDFGDDTWPSWTPVGTSVEVSYFYVFDYAYSQYSGYYGIYDTIIFKPDEDWYNGFFANGLSIDGGSSWARDGSGYVYFFFDYDE